MHLHRTGTLPFLGFLLASSVLFSGCSKAPLWRRRRSPSWRPVPLQTTSFVSPTNGHRMVRATGLVRALEWQMIRVPQISGSGVRFTLTRVIPNGD